MTAPKTWTTYGGSRITVARTVAHVQLIVTRGPAVITPADARDLAEALTHFADLADPLPCGCENTLNAIHLLDHRSAHHED